MRTTYSQPAACVLIVIMSGYASCAVHTPKETYSHSLPHQSAEALWGLIMLWPHHIFRFMTLSILNGSLNRTNPSHNITAQAQVFLCRNLNSDLIWMTVVQEWWLFVSGLCCAYFRLHKTQTVKRLQHTKVALCFVLFVCYGFKNVETSLKLLQKENKRTLFKKKSSESSPDFTKA